MLITKEFIPVGLCQCGCGGQTSISTETRRGRVKGQPNRDLPGHSGRALYDA